MGLAPRILPGQRSDPNSLTFAATEEKLAWVREAAGARFEGLELNTYPSSWPIVVTDDPRAEAMRVIDHLRGRSGVELTVDDVLGSPHLFIGSVDGLVEEVPRAARATRHQLVHGRRDRRACARRRAARRDLTRFARPAFARDRSPQRPPSFAREPAEPPTEGQPVAPGSARPHARSGPDHHARRVRVAGDLDGDADRRARARRARAVRLGLLRVLPRLADRHRRGRRGDRPGRAGRSFAVGLGLFALGLLGGVLRRRCRSSSRRGSCRGSAPGRSGRSSMSRSGAPSRRRSGRGCSRRSRPRGSCQG